MVLSQDASKAIELNIKVNEMMGSEIHVHGSTENNPNVIVRIPTISLSGENYTDQLAPDSTVLVGFESKIMHFFNEEGFTYR